jgi:hypothetical protein
MAHIRLHVQQADGHLPMVCMRCGAPATVVRTKKLSWYPRWIVLVAVLLCGLPGMIVALVLYLALRKTARLQAPLCEEHQGHWSTRLIINSVAGVLAAVLGSGGFIAYIVVASGNRPRFPDAELLEPLLCLGSIAIFVLWVIIAAVLYNSSIRPDEITATHILLNGVSEAFVDAVEEAEIERRVRLRQMQIEETQDRPYRVLAEDTDAGPPRPATSDAFEEDRRRRAPPPGAFEE